MNVKTHDGRIKPQGLGDVAQLSDLSTRVLEEHKATIISIFGEETFGRCLENPYDFFVAPYTAPLIEGFDILELHRTIKGIPLSGRIAKVGDVSNFLTAGVMDWFYGEVHSPIRDPKNFITYMALKYQIHDQNLIGLRVLTSDPKYCVRHAPLQLGS